MNPKIPQPLTLEKALERIVDVSPIAYVQDLLFAQKIRSAYMLCIPDFELLNKQQVRALDVMLEKNLLDAFVTENQGAFLFVSADMEADTNVAFAAALAISKMVGVDCSLALFTNFYAECDEED